MAGLAAVGLRRSDGTAFTSGDLVVGRHIVAVYNGAQFRTNIAPPTDAAITLSDIPNLPASRTTSGTFDVDRIPNLPASKIPDLPGLQDHERHAARPPHRHAAHASRLRRDHSRRDQGLLHQRLAMAFTRDSSLDIALGTGSWYGGASDGITLWFIDAVADIADAYVAATRARDSAKDIDLSGISAIGWGGAVSDGTTIWFVHSTISTSRAYAHTAATQARDAGNDVSLAATGFWTGAASDGTTLWFVENNADVALAYVAATRARDSAKDIALGTGDWHGGLSDGTTLWFIKNFDGGIAYLASDQSRQAADDITHADLTTGFLAGGIYANGIAWFVEPEGDTAIAFVQDVSMAYKGSTKITQAYKGSTELDRIYKGATRLF